MFALYGMNWQMWKNDEVTSKRSRECDKKSVVCSTATNEMNKNNNSNNNINESTDIKQ